MSEKTVRIGFIGTGGIAQHHLQQLSKLPQAEVVALCDIDEARVRGIAEPLGAAVFTHGPTMIDNVDMDALFICVPPFAHDDLEIRAAQKGIHLFVEKPVNLYLDKALAARDAIRAAGILSQSGYSLRYTVGGQQLKAFLADKEVGAAVAIRWSGLPALSWWRQYDRSGGQLVEMTTHQVDLMRWVMGEVVAVSAHYSVNRLLRDLSDVTVPDSQSTLLHFASGASAVITTSCAVGNTGKSSLDFVIKDATVSWKGDGITVQPEGVYEIPSPPHLPGIDAAFVRAVATGDRTLLLSPYEDALKSAAVTLAANRSAEEGGRLVYVKEFLAPEAV